MGRVGGRVALLDIMTYKNIQATNQKKMGRNLNSKQMGFYFPRNYNFDVLRSSSIEVFGNFGLITED
jgi:hypothetical protein